MSNDPRFASQLQAVMKIDTTFRQRVQYPQIPMILNCEGQISAGKLSLLKRALCMPSDTSPLYYVLRHW